MSTHPTAYEVDSATLFPQPDTHEWEGEQDGVIGYDGAGKPIKKKYRFCRLRSNHPLAYHSWSVWDDGSTHTVTLPAPGDRPDTWTDYTTCYIVVSHGAVREAEAIDGVEMMITGAEAY
jgi:hypothetical protein